MPNPTPHMSTLEETHRAGQPRARQASPPTTRSGPGSSAGARPSPRLSACRVARPHRAFREHGRARFAAKPIVDMLVEVTTSRSPKPTSFPCWRPKATITSGVRPGHGGWLALLRLVHQAHVRRRALASHPPWSSLISRNGRPALSRLLARPSETARITCA